MRCYCYGNGISCPPSGIKQCRQGVKHCYLTGKLGEEDEVHDISDCPDDSDTCNIFGSTLANFTTCCCKGSLCNRKRNLRFVYKPKVNDSALPLINSSSTQPTAIPTTTNLNLIILSIALPLAILFLLLILATFLLLYYRRSRPGHPKKRNAYVETHKPWMSAILNVFPCLYYRTLPSSNELDLDEENGTSYRLKVNLDTLPPRIEGEIIDVVNKVTKLSVCAHGRFGVVWHGRLLLDHPDRVGSSSDCTDQLSLSTDVAIKVFTMDNRQSWETEVGFYRLKGTAHQNILKFYAADLINLDSDDVQSELWLVCEYHHFGSLQNYLTNNLPLTLPQLIHTAHGIAQGLAHLHSEQLAVVPSSSASDAGGDSSLSIKPSIAHRDFNSRNILLKSDLTACIADFGLAIRFDSSQSLRDAHLQLGTRRYMAPEVLDGAIQFSRDAFLRIDVYALGLVFWELMTRCQINPTDLVPAYLAPYEFELGHAPPMEALQQWIAHDKNRPRFADLWHQVEVLHFLCETVEECWDHDAEARLSAGCVAERLAKLRSRTTDNQIDSSSECVYTTPFSLNEHQPLLSNNTATVDRQPFSDSVD